MEGGLNQITCVLDACSVINLIHIDEDDFLIKKLKNIDFYLCQKVFNEVCANVYDRIDKYGTKKGNDNSQVRERKEEIDKVLNVFRSNQKLDSEIQYEFGEDFFRTVQKLSGYSKSNGEFYSAALSLFLSRYKLSKNHPNGFVPTKLYFHTDDYPAKEQFSSFYLHQQIGHIEDTADLLVLLYRIDDNFTRKQLDRILSNLFSEYAHEVVVLEKKLRGLRETLSVSLLRNKTFMTNLNVLISKLHNYDFNGINELKDYFSQNKRKNKSIFDLIHSFNNVFDMEANSISLLDKIKTYRKDLENVYKI